MNENVKLGIKAAAWIALVGTLFYCAFAAPVRAWADNDCDSRMSWNVTNTSVIDNEAIILEHYLGQDTLRAYEADDSTELTYLSENDSVSVIADTASVSGYLYFNCTGGTESNGKATLDLYDDMDAFNGTIFNQGGETNFQDGYAEVYGNGAYDNDYIVTDTSFPMGHRWRAKMTLSNTSGGTGGAILGYDIIADGGGYNRFNPSGGTDVGGLSYQAANEWTTLFGTARDQEYIYEIRWINSTYCGFIIGGLEYATVAQVQQSDRPIAFHTHTGTTLIDWIWAHTDTYAVSSVSFGSWESKPASDQPPVTTIVGPGDGSTDLDGIVTFNCSATDDNQISNISLWTNSTGSWALNATNTSVTGTSDYAEFTVNLGTDLISVLWNCITTDNASQTDWDTNRTVYIDKYPSVDFVSPTMGNGSATLGADYIEVNVSSDEAIDSCILEIDYHNYTVPVSGDSMSCYVNFTSLGYTGVVTDYDKIWAKHPTNPLDEFPHPTGEMSVAYWSETIHMFYVDQFTTYGWNVSNSSSSDGIIGVDFSLDSSYGFTANASNDEALTLQQFYYHCTRPECEHEHYIIYPAANISEGTPANEYKVMWSDDFYAPQSEWYQCSEQFLYGGTDHPDRSGNVANPAIFFNGTGWQGVFELSWKLGAGQQLWYCYRDDPNPCGQWIYGNGDSPVITNSSYVMVGNAWIDQFGDHYIIMTGGQGAGSVWKPYLWNASNLDDMNTYYNMDADPILELGAVYDSTQTADVHLLSCPNCFNNTLIYYMASQAHSAQTGALASTNYTMNDIWGAGIQDIGELAFTVHVKDTTGNWNSSSLTYNFTVEEFSTSESYDTTAYETIPETISLTILFDETLIENVEASLFYDGVNESYDTKYTATGNHTFVTSVTPGIVQANGTNSSFNWVFTVYYPGGSSDTYNTSTANQTVYYAYWIDSVTASDTSLIESEDLDLDIALGSLGSSATLNVTVYLYETMHQATGSGGSWEASINMTAVPEPVYNYSTNYTVSLNVSYGGISRISNTTAENVTVYKIVLTNCSGISAEETLHFYIRNIEDDSLLAGDLDIILEPFVSAELARNYSWELSGQNNYSFCIYPAWARYYADSMMQYEATGYSPRNYYLYNASISNSTATIDLYLQTNTSTDLITMQVYNSLGLPQEGVYINIARYNIGTNTYNTIAIVQTNFDGKAYSYLTKNTVWYRFILSQDGEILEQYSPTIITEDTLTFRLTQGTAGEYFDYYDQLAFNCTWPSNTTTCTVTDTSGLMASASLQAWRWSALGWIDVCETSDTGSSVTLICSLGSLDGYLFYYTLNAQFTDSEQVLEAGYLNHMGTENLYGSMGILLALILLIVMVFMGVAISWEIGLAMSAVSTLLSFLGGFVLISQASVMAVFIVASVAIYKFRRS